MKKLVIIIFLFVGISITSQAGWVLKVYCDAYSGQIRTDDGSFEVNLVSDYQVNPWADAEYRWWSPVPVWAEINFKAKTSSGQTLASGGAIRKKRGASDWEIVDVPASCKTIEWYYYCAAGAFADSHVELRVLYP